MGLSDFFERKNEVIIMGGEYEDRQIRFFPLYAFFFSFFPKAKQMGKFLMSQCSPVYRDNQTVKVSFYQHYYLFS